MASTRSMASTVGLAALVGLISYYAARRGTAQTETVRAEVRRGTTTSPENVSPSAGRRRSPVAAELLAAPVVETEASTQSSELSTPDEPLQPDAENARVVADLMRSGPAARDDLDRQGYQVLTDLSAEIGKTGVTTTIDRFECSAAGCVGELLFASTDDYDRAQRALQGLTVHSPALTSWPGPRTYPPPVDESGRIRARVLLLRPDAPAARR